MLSDGRNVDAPLEKEHCVECGMIRHVSPPTREAIEAVFNQDYALYARPIGNPFEVQRQRRYADWILALIGNRPVESVFEVGAGNGSLLAELRHRAPHWRLGGVEPVPVAVHYAREEGLDLRVGLLSDIDASAIGADIVLSVNVVEHVHDPVAFLRQSASALSPTGCVIVICPDGDRPSTELLIYDHIHSFTSVALREIARQAGLIIRARVTAPASLGPFQAVLLEPGSSDRITGHSIDGLYEWRCRFLRSWQRIDDALLERTAADADNLWVFGSGENAQLLRTYAQRTWSRVHGLFADTEGTFDGRRVKIYEAPRAGERRTLLLAVRPEIQSAVAGRLLRDGNAVVQWDDLVLSGG